LFFSCVTTYETTPVSIKDAANAGKVKVKSNFNTEYYFDEIIHTDSIYYGITKKETVTLNQDHLTSLYLEEISEVEEIIPLKKIPKFSSALYAELLGTSVIGSFNYELGYHYKKTNRNKINFRLGTGITGTGNNSIVVGSNIAFGKKRSFLVVGVHNK